ncbi:nuclear transport factor 2 family protein [Streptacidiphilus pinicola]|uniref:nuclear transport factor 2 family protein n=1 Tax=Streptacidiphilus pinicola TaxID=2219663 RepID=UPI001FB21BB7|nr:nuclear transport factor 2 family protein [Streptacidiphilus pinicola]
MARARCSYTGVKQFTRQDGDLARGESYCLAHHITFGTDAERTITVASIRYLDEFVKQDGEWFFAERRLMVDWTETLP